MTEVPATGMIEIHARCHRQQNSSQDAHAFYALLCSHTVQYTYTTVDLQEGMEMHLSEYSPLHRMHYLKCWHCDGALYNALPSFPRTLQMERAGSDFLSL